MWLWRKTAVSVMAIGMLWPTSALSRLPPESPRTIVPSLAETGPTSPPIAFRIFCIKNPEQCRARWVGAVTLTPSLLQLIDDVNHSVNRTIRPRHERVDEWSIGAKVGDCEDFALTKRAHLIGSGVEAGALRIATAKTRRGEGHAVLVVRTTSGDLVLDNRFDRLEFATESKLDWLSMSSANPLTWFSVTAPAEI